MQEEYTFVRGDRVSITETLERDGAILDLTDRTVSATLRHRQDGLVIHREVDEYVDRENGEVRVTFTPEETSRSGQHYLQFRIEGGEDDPTTTPKHAMEILVLQDEQTAADPADTLRPYSFNDLGLDDEANWAGSILKDVGGFRGGWVGDGEFVVGLGENVFVDENDLLDVNVPDAGATTNATYVTTDDESEELPNATQHADLTGADLHDPAEHGSEAHTEEYATEGELDTHETETSNVHGVGESEVASTADIDTHADATDAVHGIGPGDSVAATSALFSGVHADLTAVGSDDHHTRYSDAEARSAVEGSVDVADLLGSGDSGQFLGIDETGLIWADPDTIGQHGNELHDTNFATDAAFTAHTGDDSAHHTRYTDTEAENASPVQSVFGRTGDVTPQSGDYSHTNLSGIRSDDHHTRPEAGDHLEEDLDGTFNVTTTPDHAARHEDGGVDELSVEGLGGDLADAQDPKQHGDDAHDATVASTTDVAGKANDPHGDDAHSEDYSKEGHDHDGESISPSDVTTNEIDGDVTTTPITNFEGDNLSVDIDGTLNATGGDGDGGASTSEPYVTTAATDGLENETVHDEIDGNPHGVTAAEVGAPTTEDLSDHEGATSAVHGIDESDTVAGQTDIDEHADAETGVHGVGDSTVASTADVAAKADDPHGDEAHTEEYATDAALQDHETTSAGVHGLDPEDTVAGQSDIDSHADATDDVHGIAEGDSIAAQSDLYTDAEAADAAPVQSVHGRDGDVVAESGDYTAAQVGAEPDGAVASHTANDVHTEPQPPEQHGADDHDETVPATDDLFSGSHADLSDVGADDHHARYTDAEAADAAPVQSVHGRDGDVVAESGDYSHDQLSGIGADDHHDRPVAGDHLTEDGENNFDVDPTGIDASELAGATGGAGQVLTTDGTDTTWADAASGGDGGEAASSELVRRQFNEVYRQLGQHDFELGLSMIDYLGGLYDIYVDDSKIADTQDITLSNLGSSADGDGFIEVEAGWDQINSFDLDYDDDFELTQMSNNGERVMFGSQRDDGWSAIEVFDVESGSRIDRSSFNGNIGGGAISSTGDFVAWGSSTTNTVYWRYPDDGTGGDHTRSDTVRVIDISPDGEHLAVFSFEGSRELQMWDPDSMASSSSITTIESGLVNVRPGAGKFSSDYFVYSADADEFVKVLDIGTWNEVYTLDDVESQDVAVADDWFAYTVSDGIEVREFGTWDVIAHFSASDYDGVYGGSFNHNNLQASQDGNRLTSSYGGPIHVFNVPEEIEETQFDTEHDDNKYVVGLAWSEGNTIAYPDPDEILGIVSQEADVDSGIVESEPENIGFTPDTLVLSDDADLPDGSDIVYTIVDSEDNTVDVTRGQMDEEIDVTALESDTLTVDIEMEMGVASPILYSWAAYFDEA